MGSCVVRRENRYPRRERNGTFARGSWAVVRPTVRMNPVPAGAQCDEKTPIIMRLARRSLMTSKQIAVAVALAFGLTSVGLLAAPASVFAWDAGTFNADSETQLISLTNQSRAAAGLSALKLDTTLRTFARWRSKDMGDKGYFSHSIPPDGKKVFAYMQADGYCFNVAGENIGWNRGYGDAAQATAAVHEMFMNSSSHRGNILDTSWDVIAVGAFKDANGKNLWTVLFADKCGGTTPTPTPAPTATVKPVATATATPQPTPTPTATPTATPTPTPTPEPIDTPSTNPRLPEPDDATPTPGLATPAPSPSTEPVQEPDSNQGFRVVDPPQDGGLVDSIVEQVTSRFFGG